MSDYVITTHIFGTKKVIDAAGPAGAAGAAGAAGPAGAVATDQERHVMDSLLDKTQEQHDDP